MESHNKQFRRVNWTPECITQGEEGVTRGYKDGLQPESLADGKLAGETKSTSVENWN
jgi:hypothetical protein